MVYDSNGEGLAAGSVDWSPLGLSMSVGWDEGGGGQWMSPRFADGAGDVVRTSVGVMGGMVLR